MVRKMLLNRSSNVSVRTFYRTDDIDKSISKMVDFFLFAKKLP